jgi:hypothetical protein
MFGACHLLNSPHDESQLNRPPWEIDERSRRMLAGDAGFRGCDEEQ